jgi:hypothetical protein
MWNVKSRTFIRLELSESGTGGRALVPDFHLERGAHRSGTDLERSLSVSLEFLTRLERSGTIFADTHCCLGHVCRQKFCIPSSRLHTLFGYANAFPPTILSQMSCIPDHKIFCIPPNAYPLPANYFCHKPQKRSRIHHDNQQQQYFWLVSSHSKATRGRHQHCPTARDVCRTDVHRTGSLLESSCSTETRIEE